MNADKLIEKRKYMEGTKRPNRVKHKDAEFGSRINAELKAKLKAKVGNLGRWLTKKALEELES